MGQEQLWTIKGWHFFLCHWLLVVEALLKAHKVLISREEIGIFTEECFRAFGDHVKYLITMNEQLIFATYGYAHGMYAPGRCSPGFGNCTAGNSAREPYIVAHNMLLEHSVAVKINMTKYQVLRFIQTQKIKNTWYPRGTTSGFH